MILQVQCDGCNNAGPVDQFETDYDSHWCPECFRKRRIDELKSDIANQKKLMEPHLLRLNVLEQQLARFK